MRTNIEIDDDLMARAMQAGPYKTKKDAVEAGLKLLARQGLLVSHRGVKGGYGLARPAGEIRVDQIIRALEGPVALTVCVAGTPGGQQVAHLGTDPVAYRDL